MTSYKLSEIYSDIDLNTQRIAKLTDFATSNSLTLTKIARAPGRINLISEHTELSGYENPAIATETDIFCGISFQKGAGEIKIINFNEKYPSESFSESVKIEEISLESWSKYVKFGLLAARNVAELNFQEMDLTLIFSSNLPISGNLGASTALIVVSALAFLGQKEVGMGQLFAEIIKIEQKFEVFPSVFTGKLILEAEKNKIMVLKKGVENSIEIDFKDFISGVVCACMNSLKIEDKRVKNEFLMSRNVELTACCSYLVSQKLASEDKKYNDFEQKNQYLELKSVQDFYKKFSPSGMLCSAQELPENISFGELCKFLGMENQDVAKLLKSEDISSNKTLLIKKRALHVFSEAYRTVQFEKALKCLDTPEWALSNISEEINDSQESLSANFECSNSQIDETIKAAKAAGAFCARICGVGLGGYVMALLHVQDGENFMGNLDEYYKGKGEKEMENCYFLTGSGQKASYITIE